jgi:hypothetical protein
MTSYAELRTVEFPFGANLSPPANLVGGYLAGPLYGRREVVLAEPNYAAFHEADERLNLDAEGYATVYQYPRGEYVEHVRRHGSPKGYAGATACTRLVWDVDRKGDPQAALDAARSLARFITDRYGDDGFGAAFSGDKGYHLSLVCPPGFHPLPHVPGVTKQLCLTVARSAGVAVDPAVYDRQRLFRLPNTKHPRTGLQKRYLDPDELHRLTADAVHDLARHPAGFAVPRVTELNPTLEADWLECEHRVLTAAPAAVFGPTGASAHTPSRCPVVPKFVLDFIAFGDIADPGRAVTLFRAAAALSAEGTPPGVIIGLLRENALKAGLDPAEADKQLADGIAHGQRQREGVTS